jgi:UDPglucose--hexose-1-phosphate uridylyltransferase
MVLEFRKDPTKGSVVIIASDRAQRPEVFTPVSCPFCPGAEQATPPATLLIPREGDWNVRCFPNAYSVVKPGFEFKKEEDGNYFWRSPAFGFHEVIVETSEHDKLWQNMSDEQLQLVFQAYKNRFVELGSKQGIECVYLFKNFGRNAGTSIEHEHAQIVAFPFVPETVEREVENSRKFLEKTGKCIFCEILFTEKVLFENDSFKCIAPSFARFPFECWIIPKRHCKSIAELNDEDGRQLMLALRECIKRVYEVSKDYNLAFHNSPKNGELHFHVEIYPRPNKWAGVELGTSAIVNIKSEEDAIKTLGK